MKVVKKNLLLHVFLLLFFSVNAQNSLDSLLVKRIENLVAENKKQEASKLLFNSLSNLRATTSNKNDLATEYEKYRTYFQKITKDVDVRKNFFDDLIWLRENAIKTDSLGLVKAYYFAANDAAQLRKYQLEALNYVEKGIEYWVKFYDKPTDLYAQMLTQKGASLQNLGLTYEAFSTNEETLQVYESVKEPNKSILYSLSIQLAKNYTKYGFFNKAAYHLNKADNILVSEAEKFKDSEQNLQLVNGYQLYLLSTYSRYYRDVQNEEKLLSNIKRADGFAEGKELVGWASYYYAETYNYAGFYYLNVKKDYQKALEMFTNARVKISSKYNPIYFDYYDLNKARALVELNQIDKALQTFELLEKKRLPSSLKGIVYMSKAYALSKENNFEQAIKAINSGLKVFSKSKGQLNILSDKILSSFKPTGELYDTNHYLKLANQIQLKKQKTTLEKTLVNNLYKIAQKQFKSSYQKNVYSKVLEEMYNTIANGLLKSNKERYGNFLQKENNFLETLIADKSSFLWHKFLINRTSSVFKTPDSLSIKEDNLRKRLLLYQKHKQSNKNDSTLNYKITETEEKIELLTNQIHKNYVNFNLFDTNKFSLLDFQKKLASDKIVLSYKVFQNNLYQFVITKNDIKAQDLGSYNAIEERILEFISDVSNLEVKVSDIKTRGSELFDLLALKNAKAFPKITIIPDKALHYLSFDVLSENNKYLIEDKNITYAISLPFLSFSDAINPNSKKSPKLFSPTYSYNQTEQEVVLRNAMSTLLGAKEEAAEISKIIKGDLYDGEKATKQNFIEKTENTSILHLAMHAYLDEENSNLSNLIFSNSSDNKLYLSELYGLNLNSDLVVLGACNTAVGKEKLGEGIISLNRAFTYAGVPTTISSLWSLPDVSTKQIMVDFYKNLKEDKIPSKALRAAKLSYIKNNSDKSLHPMFWGGLVLHGKDSIIEIPSTNYTVWLTLISLLVLFVLVYSRVKKSS